MCEQTVKKLFDFIEASPSQFHAIENQKQRLLGEGYEQLLESKAWDLKTGGKDFVTRNGSSIIAFRIPQGEFNGFQIMASHSDAPCFKIKENPEMMAEGHYVKLNVEKYGGLICSTWFDRPLSVAGRLIVKENGKLVVCCPYGLNDLFSMTIRPVKRYMDKKSYDERCQRWKNKWDKLNIVEW